MKLALVHDWLKNISGAERVLIELHKIFPDAPIYTLFYDKKFTQKWLPDADIRASFLQKIPLITKSYWLFAWLMPTAIEAFDLSEFDRVLSSSVIFSKGLILKPSTKHICYCYSPTRFLWDRNSEARITNYESWSRLIFNHLLRLWDRASADRVDQFIAISKVVQSRIKKYYRRDSIVIYPPISLPTESALRNRESSIFNLKIGTPFYLIVSRLHKYKNIDIAIEAFNKLNYPLIIIGAGPDGERLRRLAGDNIMFLGEQDDSTLVEYYRTCRAFIMPQEEDFGLTPIEAMSFGKPVVALRQGGAVETVIEGQTGEFFDDPIPEALADAVRRLNENYANYNPETIKVRASLFSPEKFKSAIIKIIT
ncbi:MAG: glycosyltransferase [bacterium]|nr:glycosyltransferase [bacterium]